MPHDQILLVIYIAIGMVLPSSVLLIDDSMAARKNK